MMMRLTVKEYEVALKYVKGRYAGTLGPGGYWVWTWLGDDAVVVDVRLTAMAVAGQEVLTKDRLPVRLTLALRYRVADAAKAVNTARDAEAMLYEDVQLALRELTAERDLAELAADKAALGTALTQMARAKAAAYGLEVVEAGVKDLTLPGPVKALALKVEEERYAAREELAAARVRANTAKLLAAEPALMRLAELDALRELADKPGTTVKLKVQK